MFLPLGFGILSSFIGMLAIPAFLYLYHVRAIHRTKLTAAAVHHAQRTCGTSSRTGASNRRARSTAAAAGTRFAICMQMPVAHSCQHRP